MEIICTSDVGAPAAEVFALHADIAGWAEHMGGITEVEVLTAGAIDVGTRFRETRVLFGKSATETMEVVAFDPPEAFVLEAESCGSAYRTEFRFVSRGASATRVVYKFSSSPQTSMAKLMAPLGKLFKGKMVKLVEQDLRDMRAVAEARAGG